jgi:hypothetical protein
VSTPPSEVLGSTLASLAVLRVNADYEGRDYIDLFVPFVVYGLRLAPQRQVSLPDLQANLLNEFGLQVPQAALRTILGRARGAGYVKVENGVYTRVDERIRERDIDPVRQDGREKCKTVVDALVTFAGNAGVDWTPELAEQHFLRFLGERSAPLLENAAVGSFGHLEGSSEDDYLVHRFVVDAFEDHLRLFGAIETLIRGSVLANVLYFPEIANVGSALDRLNVYLDTRIILRALGTAGPTLEGASKELIQAARGLGATVCCFNPTAMEVRGVLSGAARALRDPEFRRSSTSESIEYLLRSGASRSDIETLIATLDLRLRDIGIQVRKLPAYLPALTIDEAAFGGQLERTRRYPRPEAIEHDVSVVSAIHRLRNGTMPMRLEMAGAIFVTTNTLLVQESTAFLAAEYGSAPVPACIGDQSLGTLLWLKNPQASPGLPTSMAISDCYAALNPAPALWNRYLQEIGRLEKVGGISPDDYHLLRYSTSAVAALMDATGGDPSAFSEGTVPEVLEKAMDNLTAEMRRQLELKSRELDSAAASVRDLERSIAHARNEREARIRQTSDRAARLFAALVFVLLALLLVTGAILVTVGITEVDVPSFAAILVFNVIGALGMLFGTSILGIQRSLRRLLAPRIAAGLSKMLTDDERVA